MILSNPGPIVQAKALPFPRDVRFFAIPSAVMTLAIYVSVARLDQAGVPLEANVRAHFVLLLGGLGVLGIVLAFREEPAATAVRMGLAPLKITDLLTGLLIGGYGLWLYDALQGVSGAAVSGLHLDPPDWLTRFHTDTTFLGIPMAGHWWLLDIFAVFYIANVVGEVAGIYPASPNRRRAAHRLASQRAPLVRLPGFLRLGRAGARTRRDNDRGSGSVAP